MAGVETRELELLELLEVAGVETRELELLELLEVAGVETRELELLELEIPILVLTEELELEIPPLFMSDPDSTGVVTNLLLVLLGRL